MLNLFADVSPPVGFNNNAIPPGQSSNTVGLGLREIMLIVGIAVILGLLLFLWAYLTHRLRRHHHSGSRKPKPVPEPIKASSSEGVSSHRGKMRRRRHRHPANLSRNPTLGETGGLPPIRPEEPPSEVAPQ